jgi:hypothetical protein
MGYKFLRQSATDAPRPFSSCLPAAHPGGRSGQWCVRFCRKSLLLHYEGPQQSGVVQCDLPSARGPPLSAMVESSRGPSLIRNILQGDPCKCLAQQPLQLKRP